MNASSIKQHFSRAAGTYDQAALLHRHIAHHLLSRFEGLNFQPNTILECGCGTGYLTRELKKTFKAAHIMALDFALPMLQQARQQFSWFKKVPLICGDSYQLPIKNESVELIISSAMLQWCDMQRVFTEWNRVLKPNGLVMFSSFGPDTLQELRKSWAEVDEQPHVHDFADMHDVGDSLTQTGYADVVMDVETFELAYKQPQDLLQELKNLGATNSHQQRQKGLMGKGKLNAVYQQLNAFRNERKMIPCTYEVVYGHGWKVGPPLQQHNNTGHITEVAIPISQLRRKA